jgi:PAS domain S-box-containing protein
MPSQLDRSRVSKVRVGPDQFRLMVEGVLDYGIFMLDTDGRIATWNAGAERIKGYQESEIIGKHFSIFYPEEDVRSGKPEWELEVAQQQGRFEDEGWRLRKDGSKFWANVIITAIRDHDGHLVGYGKVTRDFTERKEHEERVVRSEEKFRLLVDGARDYAIYLLDPDGTVITWNAGAERIKGYTASEIIGMNFSIFFSEEDVRSGKPQQILNTALREGRAEQEGWRIRKDGSRFWVNAVAMALRDKSGQLVGFSKITRDVTERMRQREELSKSEEALRNLSLNLLRTQDEERKRIGREMHDSLGQYLSALKMKLGTLRISHRDLDPKTAEEIAQCSSILEECVKEVRTISYLLYPPMLEEMGLKSAVNWYLEGFAERSGIKTSFDVSTDFERVSRVIELALFRVLQESLNNVHKHSGSTRVDIHLSLANGIVTLEIRDYGKGLPELSMQFDKGLSTSPLGIGLRGMAERARQLGGEFVIANVDPGACVRVKIPAQEESRTKTGC